jgi:hypothetical protein
MTVSSMQKCLTLGSTGKYIMHAVFFTLLFLGGLITAELTR